MTFTLLTEKQLVNLPTARLNAYRKEFPKKMGQLQHIISEGGGDNDDLIHLNKLKEHYSVILDVMSSRGHAQTEKTDKGRNKSRKNARNSKRVH